MSNTVPKGHVVNRLKEIRISKGWTQQDLVDASGLSQPTIIKMEHGGFIAIQLETIIRISHALCLPMHEWLTYYPEDSPTPPPNGHNQLVMQAGD